MDTPRSTSDQSDFGFFLENNSLSPLVHNVPNTEDNVIIHPFSVPATDMEVKQSIATMVQDNSGILQNNMLHFDHQSQQLNLSYDNNDDQNHQENLPFSGYSNYYQDISSESNHSSPAGTSSMDNSSMYENIDSPPGSLIFTTYSNSMASSPMSEYSYGSEAVMANHHQSLCIDNDQSGSPLTNHHQSLCIDNDQSGSPLTDHVQSESPELFLFTKSPSAMFITSPTTRNTSSPSSVTSSSSSNSSSSTSSSAIKKGLKKKGQAYIPSYMDLSSGPEPCVVCADAATGFHYKCMTCEGCKGFFRRTIQKELKYQCKYSGDCTVDKTTRNNCQQCRFNKCLAAGMAIDLVLNAKQRVAKRQLIQGNRVRRKQENVVTNHQLSLNENIMTTYEESLIENIVTAYEETTTKTCSEEIESVQLDNSIHNVSMWQQLADTITPSILKVIQFAKQVPGFLQLLVEDQMLLLKACCMELMCLRVACRYNPQCDSITLHSGRTLTTRHPQDNYTGLGSLTKPIFEFAVSLSKLQLDQTEVALLAAVLLMQSDRTGLKDSDKVEKHQDAILGTYKKYTATKRPSQPVHWAKILMKITDLRTICSRHADSLLSTKVDHPHELPPLFLDIFYEGNGSHVLQLG